MLISKGKPSPSEPWRILEVAIGQSPDALALRFSKAIKRLHEKGVEALIPFKRNANGEPEWIIEHVYVRGANGSLGSLARTPGIDFIRKEIPDAEWIARLIRFEETQKMNSLTVGQFVRVLTGPCARMCGTITAQKDDWMEVTILMRTKKVKVYTAERNLQAVDCLPENQTFFYDTSLFQ
jgi:hypothetical protein